MNELDVLSAAIKNVEAVPTVSEEAHFWKELTLIFAHAYLETVERYEGNLDMILDGLTAIQEEHEKHV